MNLNKKKIYSYILFGLLALFYYVFIVGDPIYSVNYILKIALYEQSPKTLSIINSIAVQLFLYLLPVLALFIYIRLQKDRNRRHEVMALSLITLIISSNLALNVLQFNKDYNLAYNYGESRKDQVILYLQKILKKDDLVLGPLDIVYYVTDNYSGIFLSSGLLKRPRDIETLLSNQAACVVYGRNSFNKDTYQKIINSSWFQDQLHSKFIPTQIGTYTIWMRRVSKKQRE